MFNLFQCLLNAPCLPSSIPATVDDLLAVLVFDPDSSNRCGLKSLFRSFTFFVFELSKMGSWSGYLIENSLDGEWTWRTPLFRHGENGTIWVWDLVLLPEELFGKGLAKALMNSLVGMMGLSKMFGVCG
ncbi:hypothetical protein Salat_1156600 [Sesamum alatum]|uniref:Uncharacterized protein n=1 Tax=Sesamum alatum TaxID=300844 RepID=A0AAE2CND3_9LAMI|nr:hypothetical protein Salat_1156600 [Sesamum alatum]